MYYLSLAIVVSGVAASVPITGEAVDAEPPTTSAAIVTDPATTTGPAVTASTFDWPQIQAAVVDVAIWGVVGILLLGVARVANDRLVLRKFNTTKEIIEDKNVGTGVVEGAAYVSSAFIIRASVTGETEAAGLVEDVGLTVLFFTLSQVMLAALSIVYQAVTKYDLHAEIERDNVAVGVGFAGPLVALGIILAAGQRFSTGDDLFGGLELAQDQAVIGHSGHAQQQNPDHAPNGHIRHGHPDLRPIEDRRRHRRSCRRYRVGHDRRRGRRRLGIDRLTRDRHRGGHPRDDNRQAQVVHRHRHAQRRVLLFAELAGHLELRRRDVENHLADEK